MADENNNNGTDGNGGGGDNGGTGGGADTRLQDAVDREDRRAMTTQDRIDNSLEAQQEERERLQEPAEIGSAAATKMEASGAIIEDGAKKMVDADHPAVDNNPRAGTTVAQNRVDFNDPTLNDRQAVEQRLRDQD